MDIKISSHSENDVLVIETSGDLNSLDERKLITHKYYEEITKQDLRKIILNELKLKFPTTIMDQCELAKFYGESFPTEVRTWKVALVVDIKYKQEADFWETYCHNRGFPYKAFYKLEDARAWLSTKP